MKAIRPWNDTCRILQMVPFQIQLSLVEFHSMKRNHRVFITNRRSELKQTRSVHASACTRKILRKTPREAHQTQWIAGFRHLCVRYDLFEWMALRQRPGEGSVHLQRVRHRLPLRHVRRRHRLRRGHRSPRRRVVRSLESTGRGAASHVLVDWVGLTWILSVPLSAQFCLGGWEFGRSSWARWVAHPNQRQPNPGPRTHGTPCIKRVKAKPTLSGSSPLAIMTAMSRIRLLVPPIHVTRARTSSFYSPNIFFIPLPLSL